MSKLLFSGSSYPKYALHSVSPFLTVSQLFFSIYFCLCVCLYAFVSGKVPPTQ